MRPGSVFPFLPFAFVRAEAHRIIMEILSNEQYDTLTLCLTSRALHHRTRRQTASSA